MNETNSIRKVITASSVGTMIEWYDFYIFGMLAKTISQHFFPEGNSTAALLSTLAIFAAGFIVRPFGALVFGRLGDLIGRKYTFLLTLVLMGGSTFLIGLVPDYKTIGIAAPLLVLLLRIVQGLALGGEYGGAATYVAEHAPANRRGYYTSWIQTTATLGLFVALGIIMLVKLNMSDADFNSQWGGWRYPFWISILLVGISVYIRLKMHESPLFSKLKSEGKTSTNPLKESFSHKSNFKMVLLALFGAVMGQGVIWYTGQFYAQNFLETKCNLEFGQSRTIMLWAIAAATPFFLFFGWLSDRIGRKWIMLTGMLLGVLCYRPIFSTFLRESKVDKEMIQGYGIIREGKETVTMTDLKDKEGDIHFCTADIGWITGHSYILYGPLSAGATSLMFEGIPTWPDAGRFWDIVDKHKVNILYTAPTAIRSLMGFGLEPLKGKDLSSLKILGTVGEPINEEAWHWYDENIGKKKCPIVDTWWQTETGGVLISNLAGITPAKPSWATLPMPGVQPVLVDENGKEVTQKDEDGLLKGNLCIKAPWPSILRTTYGDHERCRKNYFATYGDLYFTGDGALKDDKGFYRITGRVDDVLNVSGHRIGTAEVENALNMHAGVVESAVVGYPHNIKGQGIYAYVIFSGKQNDAELTKKDILATVSRIIGPIAKPDKIQFVSGLPKTRSGKIMRRILRKIAEGETENLGDTSTLLDPGVVDEIRKGKI